MARNTSSLPDIASSRVSCAKGCIVTVIRSIVRAFRGDGMRLHRGGGRVVAHARRHLGGQVSDTVIRHRPRFDLPPAAMGSHRVSMIKLPLQARLMPCIGSPTCQPIAHSATSRTVDLAVIVELAETDDRQAPCATNPRTNPVFLHARTSTAALAEVAPPVPLRAPSPGQRPRATRRLRLYTWAFIYFAVIDRLRDLAKHRHFSADPSMSRLLRNQAMVNRLMSAVEASISC
jgi:hypothetical protein